VFTILRMLCMLSFYHAIGSKTMSTEAL